MTEAEKVSLRLIQDVNELMNDFSNVITGNKTEPAILDCLDSALERLEKLFVQAMTREQELRLRGSLIAEERWNKRRFQTAAKTLLQSEAIQDLIDSALRFRDAVPGQIPEILPALRDSCALVGFATEEMMRHAC